jgi:hypothetical protein
MYLKDEPIVRTWQDGSYLFILYTEPVDNEPYTLDVTVSFLYKNGYLSANDWPFLPVSVKYYFEVNFLIKFFFYSSSLVSCVLFILCLLFIGE